MASPGVFNSFNSHFVGLFRSFKLLIQAVDLLQLGFIEDLKHRETSVSNLKLTLLNCLSKQA